MELSAGFVKCGFAVKKIEFFFESPEEFRADASAFGLILEPNAEAFEAFAEIFAKIGGAALTWSATIDRFDVSQELIAASIGDDKFAGEIQELIKSSYVDSESFLHGVAGVSSGIFLRSGGVLQIGFECGGGSRYWDCHRNRGGWGCFGGGWGELFDDSAGSRDRDGVDRIAGETGGVDIDRFNTIDAGDFSHFFDGFGGDECERKEGQFFEAVDVIDGGITGDNLADG
jgi:hypothetical protein